MVRTSAAATKFLGVLRNNPSVAPEVRSICGNLRPKDGYRKIRDSGTESTLALLSRTTGLVRLCGWATDDFDLGCNLLFLETPISWHAFEAVAKSSGFTLQEFSMRVGTRERVLPTLFSNFTQLRCLDWKCDSTFDFKSEDVPSDGLPNLEELRIWCLDHSLLSVLCLMKYICLLLTSSVLNFRRLKSLRHLVLSDAVRCQNLGAFLEAHGSKLTELEISSSSVAEFKVNIFKVCPNLGSITVDLHMVRTLGRYL